MIPLKHWSATFLTCSANKKYINKKFIKTNNKKITKSVHAYCQPSVPLQMPPFMKMRQTDRSKTARAVHHHWCASENPSAYQLWHLCQGWPKPALKADRLRSAMASSDTKPF